MTNNKITIVITAFKSDVKIINCLNSIDSNYKVIIIENSNDKNFKNKIEEKYKNTQCILAGENLGYAKGNNLGLSKVTTKYALILNPDAILSNTTINNFLIRAEYIKNFAIIGPATQENKKNINKIEKFKEVSSVKGFAMFLKMEEFTEIGFFDENIFIYLEEVDLCKRLIKNKKKIFIDPDILVKHQGGSSHDKQYNFEMELSRNWHWMWSFFYYNKKHKGYMFALATILKKLFSSVLKFIYYSIIFNKQKKMIYFHRLSGLINSIIGKPSWYRPKIN